MEDNRVMIRLQEVLSGDQNNHVFIFMSKDIKIFFTGHISEEKITQNHIEGYSTVFPADFVPSITLQAQRTCKPRSMNLI